MHHETLTDAGKLLFPKLVAFRNFYLAGGTALALQIGHRVSVDFDCFMDEPIKRTLLDHVEDVFRDEKRSIAVNNRRELTLFVSGVKLTFLHYPFPSVLPLVSLGDITALSVMEIGATKAYTIGRRGELKDYIDLYCILKNNLTTLNDISALARQKYGDAFEPRLFFEQLLYWDDLEMTPITFLGEAPTRETMESYFADAIHGQALDT